MEPRGIKDKRKEQWLSRHCDPVLQRLRQKDNKFKVSLGNIVRPCQKEEGKREEGRGRGRGEEEEGKGRGREGEGREGREGKKRKWEGKGDKGKGREGRGREGNGKAELEVCSDS